MFKVTFQLPDLKKFATVYCDEFEIAAFMMYIKGLRRKEQSTSIEIPDPAYEFFKDAEQITLPHHLFVRSEKIADKKPDSNIIGIHK